MRRACCRPQVASTVYFAITGTPDGGRNELSLKNEFSVLVTRTFAAATSVATNEPVVSRLVLTKKSAMKPRDFLNFFKTKSGKLVCVRRSLAAG
jgi:hypothetical protein